MIITRTPLRISLGGGGTDLPSYYRNSDGGFLVAAAIDKYIYIAINRNFGSDILLKYSSIERVTKPADVEHPLLREALIASGVEEGVEISSMADIPAGTGLGSSGAFTVGVLKALLAHSHQIRPNKELAELACEIEIEQLKAPVGRQDQYIAATGGVTAFEFLPDDTVNVIPVEMTGEARASLEENLVLFYTGVSRSAAGELANQAGPSQRSAPTDLTDNLNAVKALGLASFEALGVGDLTGFAELLTQQWKLKLQRSPTELHQQIDGWIERGLTAGAGGGKLVGAGGGGFILFYAESKADLRAEMLDLGLDEVRFAFDYEGSTTIVSR